MTNDVVADATSMTNDWAAGFMTNKGIRAAVALCHGGAAAVIEAQRGHSS